MNFEQAWERTSGVEGWLHKNEGRLLWETCERAVGSWPGPGTIVEIGAYKGRSTTLLGQYAQEVGEDLIVVEPFWYGEGEPGLDGRQEHDWMYTEHKFQADTYASYMANMSGLPHTLIVEPSSRVNFNVYDIAMAFIDGDHTESGVLMDCYKIMPRVVVGGMVAFHDYRPDVFGVKPVVDWLLGEAQERWVLEGQESELVVVRRKSVWV